MAHALDLVARPGSGRHATPGAADPTLAVVAGLLGSLATASRAIDIMCSKDASTIWCCHAALLAVVARDQARSGTALATT
jgi:hypothetical protein